MNRLLRDCLLALVGLAIFALPATADWNLGDPYKMHYPQLPDLTPTGMDILATRQLPNVGPQPLWKILADDWRCTASGPVSDIHIWGSWLNDILPAGPTGEGDPRNVVFKLSIHKDIPANSGVEPRPYSRPEVEPVWQRIFQPGQFTVRPWGTAGATELFFDPNLSEVIGADHMIWQYNFMNFPEPFRQEAGNIYWLDVQAMSLAAPGTPEAYFGWKTTNPLETPHFMDDAVFGDTLDFGGPLMPPGWRPLVYPAGHQFAGQSIDMAFVITPEPGTIAMLLGAGAVGLVLLARRRWKG